MRLLPNVLMLFWLWYNYIYLCFLNCSKSWIYSHCWYLWPFTQLSVSMVKHISLPRFPLAVTDVWHYFSLFALYVSRFMFYDLWLTIILLFIHFADCYIIYECTATFSYETINVCDWRLCSCKFWRFVTTEPVLNTHFWMLFKNIY